MKKKVLIILGILLIVIGIVFIGISAFGTKIPSENVLSGGKVDNTDLSAPKEINSKNVVGLNFSFYIEHNDPIDDDYTGFYNFVIKDGVLSEEHLNISEPIDSSVTAKVQELIEKYNLVKKNGVDKHTAGLPPEYQPYYFTANYDSGEKLYISENNNPYDECSRDFFDLFRQVFIDLGHEELKPSKESTTITQFELKFNIGEKTYEFFPFETVEDDEIKLMRITANIDEENSGITEVSKLDNELYEELSKLLAENNLKRIHEGSFATGNDCPHTKDGYYEVYIDFENKKQIYGFSTDSEKVADFAKDAEKIRDLFDEYMKNHDICTYEW